MDSEYFYTTDYVFSRLKQYHGMPRTYDCRFTAVCRSIDQNSSHSTQERCLLVALVQTVYTTYGNDGSHFRVGTATAAAGSIGYPGGGGRRSGNSCTNSSRHRNDGCTSSGWRDGNNDSTNSSGRSATVAAGAPVAGGGARSLQGPCYHIFICSLL